VLDAYGEQAIGPGLRSTAHPVRPSDDWASVRQQAGNADDSLMRAVHGPHWHRRAAAPAGRLPAHVAVVAAGVLGLAGVVVRRRGLAAVGLLGWAAGTAELATARIIPGPGTRDEVRRMILTSLVIPPAAVYHRLRGWVSYRRAPAWRGAPDLVLLDRDGTLVHDVPYNGEPGLVAPIDGVAEALDRLRGAGVRIAVVTNQSGLARGLFTEDDLAAVNARVEELLGPFDGWYVCPHGEHDGCDCRKPAAGLVKRACAEHDVDPRHCLVIGDIGSDVEAAAGAGARAILVPTSETLGTEVLTAPIVALDVEAAVDLALGGRW
jgi:histidinol-phosphate phosphatase family protein